MRNDIVPRMSMNEIAIADMTVRSLCISLMSKRKPLPSEFILHLFKEAAVKPVALAFCPKVACLITGHIITVILALSDVLGLFTASRSREEYDGKECADNDRSHGYPSFHTGNHCEVQV
ncbi:hypothetical protein D3C81_1600650 [compost metagenome]